MARIFTVVLVLIALLAATLAWSGQSQEKRADFAFINRGDNKSLDPNNMSWMQDIRLAYGLWEGFYSLDPVTLRPILGSADSAQVSPDQLTWTFHIRPDAKWSNGDSLKAQDFLFEWRRMLETPGEYTYLHHYIAGRRNTKAFSAITCPLGKTANPRRRPIFRRSVRKFWTIARLR